MTAALHGRRGSAETREFAGTIGGVKMRAPER